MVKPALSPEKFSTFGSLLKYLRKREELTQREFAIMVGYSDTQISRLEQNQRVPDAATLQALFVPALHIEREPQWVERLLELAGQARRGDLNETQKMLTPNNLPAALTTFIGREKEQSVLQLIAMHRLVTLTASGGVGKTRMNIIDIYPILYGRYLKVIIPSAEWGYGQITTFNVYATSNPNLDTEYATCHKTYTPFYDNTYGRWQRISLTNDRSYYYYKLECAGNWGGEDSKIKIAEWEMVERIELEAKTYRIMAGTLSNFTNVWPAEESIFENPIFYATNDMFNMIGNFSVMKSSAISGSLDMIVRY